ncbi:hypothetical protein GOBAR_AA00865 [Gossypium barbadense]|uniref:Uncharacterized protein n=1 Tax=Gossypium barbadense TaxID=3634 RepID=A0A2P5YVP7_GOSBA|nr:hypothetical protein GOBAR_AA00865 [Gossypium barbadense]
MDADGDDGYVSSDPSDHEVDNDPDVDEVSNDINDEGMNNDKNVSTPLVRNPIQRIVIHNNLGAHMLLVDPYAVYAAEFPNYHDILPPHWLAIGSKPEELFVGQKFETKEEYVFSIKWYR